LSTVYSLPPSLLPLLNMPLCLHSSLCIQQVSTFHQFLRIFHSFLPSLSTCTPTSPSPADIVNCCAQLQLFLTIRITHEVKSGQVGNGRDEGSQQLTSFLVDEGCIFIKLFIICFWHRNSTLPIAMLVCPASTLQLRLCRRRKAKG